MSMLGPFTNFHEMNLDWLLEEWRETKEAIIGDQSQWKEFKAEMTAAWEKYKKTRQNSLTTILPILSQLTRHSRKLSI